MPNIKSIIFTFLIFFGNHNLFAQQTTIYFLPGQGSDHRIFDSLKFDQKYKLKYIDYGTPKKYDNMESFAKSIAAQIDTTEKFILIGVSLGGMISVELNEILSPEKVILISSAKTKYELPARYRFQKYFPFYRIIPGRLLLAGAKILQPIVEPDRKTNKIVFKSMLGTKKPKYIKRTVNMIINWNKKNVSKNNLVHIHGTNDHTIPFKNIKANFTVNNGSHMMVLTMFEELQKILDLIL
jgi:pimeloyl-ACP methyl ester carboxylesterase